MKSAHFAQVATRLDLLEQKVAAGGGEGELRALVERIFDRVLGWSYTEPNNEQAIKTPPSANQSFYDLAGDVGYSMQRTILGTSGQGGYSEATEWHAQNISFWDLTFGGLTQAQEVFVNHGSIMSYIQSLETRIATLESMAHSH